LGRPSATVPTSRFQTSPASSDRAPRDSAPSRRCFDRTILTAPARLRCRRRVSLLPPRAQHATGRIAFAHHAPELTSLLHPTIGASPHNYHRIHRRSSVLRDALPQADHRVACRAINRCHRPLLRPVTNGSPPPELPRAPPHALLPPVLLQPSHHSVRSPPTHRPSTAHQQPPSTYGPRCRRRAHTPDSRCHEQPDSGEDSPLLTPKIGHPSTPICSWLISPPPRAAGSPESTGRRRPVPSAKAPLLLAVGCQPRPSQPICWAELEAGAG
jgi:hypothetical protein